MTNQYLQQQEINHVALVLDASSSMDIHATALIKVADEQIKYLARRSQELNQETRVSIYVFADTVSCVVFDKDVLRLPSISSLYQARGNTALIDATILSIDDLMLTCTKYGNHGFLIFVLTDGEENRSKANAFTLGRRLAAKRPDNPSGLPDNFTIAALVPNARAVHEAKRFGFAPGNIEVWDTSEGGSGIEDVGRTIKAATDNYMAMRSTGVTKTSNLFTMDTQAVSKASVASLGVKPLDRGKYNLIHIPGIPEKTEISDFVRNTCNLVYRIGGCYYQLTKPEKLQPSKKIALVEKKTEKIYVGYEARQLLGLPDYEVKVAPASHPDYTIFVQSMSVNRHLVPHTKLLMLL